MQQSSNSAASIECRELVIGYDPGAPIVSGITCTIEGPVVVRLDDRNGVGKSTFIESCSGYLRPLSGEILIGGHPADSPRSRRRRRVCRTQPALYPYLSARDHLVLASKLNGVPLDESIARAESLGLGEWLSARTSALSTGTARKLWYVMNSLGDFDVLLLDEPFNGVDEQAIAVMCDEIDAWATRSLVIVVCHVLPPKLRVDSIFSLQQAPVVS